MPEVSFYILSSVGLSDQSAQERYLFACKLIEKIYRSGHFCYVLTDSSEQSRMMDDLLWSFRPGSFIPHRLYKGDTDTVPADDWERNVILIGSLIAPAYWRKTIVNLSSQCPEDFELSGRILEILDNNEESKQHGRNRYRRYQQAGINISTHKIAADKTGD